MQTTQIIQEFESEVKKIIKNFDINKFNDWRNQRQINKIDKATQYVDSVEYASVFTLLVQEVRQQLDEYKGSEENKKKLKDRYEKLYYCYKLFLQMFSIIHEQQEIIKAQNELLETLNN